MPDRERARIEIWEVRVPETRPRRGKCILCQSSVVARIQRRAYPGSGHVVRGVGRTCGSTPIFTGPTIGTDRNLADPQPNVRLWVSEMQLVRF